MLLRVLVVFGILPVVFIAAERVVPITACEVLSDLRAPDGKEVEVWGVYFLRKVRRWIGAQSCDPSSSVPPMLWLPEDSSPAPKPPGNFELDAATLNRKFAAMLKLTSLGKFRFGTSDYDRWAVVYGRVVPHKGEDTKKTPADLVFRGSGVVIFLTTEK